MGFPTSPGRMFSSLRTPPGRPAPNPCSSQWGPCPANPLWPEGLFLLWHCLRSVFLRCVSSGSNLGSCKSRAACVGGVEHRKGNWGPSSATAASVTSCFLVSCECTGSEDKEKESATSGRSHGNVYDSIHCVCGAGLHVIGLSRGANSKENDGENVLG